MTARRALITGISGQDGSYLAELLLDAGFEVHGLVHHSGLGLAEHLAERIEAHRGDVTDATSIERALTAARPDEVYHLAAVTAPGKSWGDATGTFDVVAGGTARLLAAVEAVQRDARVLVAGSAEIYGAPETAPQDEGTPFAPRNPYGAAKAAAVAAARAYRAGRGMFVAVGILYNHESPRRPVGFLPRKVSWHAAAIATGRASELRLGNLEARRDWGWAPEYMAGCRRMLQADAPGDYVLATGVLHSVRELVQVAFDHAAVPVEGHVVVDERFVRPEHGVPLVGDASKAREELGWRASRPFEVIIREMVDCDLEAMRA